MTGADLVINYTSLSGILIQLYRVVLTLMVSVLFRFNTAAVLTRAPELKNFTHHELVREYGYVRRNNFCSNSPPTKVTNKMVKKSKLLAALDAHKGKDYKLEKQKILQKKAEKRKKTKQREQSEDTEEGEEKPEAKKSIVEPDGSEGWESDESENAAPAAVCV